MKRLVATAAAAILLTTCGFGLNGSGPVKDETRQVAPFTRIETGDGIELSVHIGPQLSVQVRAQENILPIIATTVEGDVLKIRGTQGYSTSEGVTATVVLLDLNGISLSGGSEGRADGLNAQHLDVAVSGGAGLTASGTAVDVSVDASGGAHVDLRGLQSKAIKIEISGGATANLNAVDDVSGSASGGAHVAVSGGANLNVATSGGAEVVPE
jgi:hypothetical protein